MYITHTYVFMPLCCQAVCVCVLPAYKRRAPLNLPRLGIKCQSAGLMFSMIERHSRNESIAAPQMGIEKTHLKGKKKEKEMRKKRKDVKYRVQRVGRQLVLAKAEGRADCWRSALASGWDSISGKRAMG